YELLFRDATRNGPGEGEDARSAASSQLLLRGFVDGGDRSLCEGKPAFVNIPAGWIEGGMADFLPMDSVVLEVEASRALSVPSLQRLEELRARGFRVAIDRAHVTTNSAAFGRAADFIKVDARRVSAETLEAIVSACPDATVIATHVENRASFEMCRDAGAGGFQGYFLSRPHVVEEGEVAAGRSRSAELLVTALGDMKALQRVIKLDPVLTYRLLRVANSVYYRRGDITGDVQRALELLGEDGVRKWLSMVALATVKGKPSVLLDAALIRARTAELIALRSRKEHHSFFFMVGMFSLLDALMDRSLEALLEGLPGSERLQVALLDKKGPGAEILETVVAQELGDFDRAQLPCMDRLSVQEAYLDAIVWVRAMGGLLRE
ncbi:MAG: EAL and HDOD domain-containing protein, partial [Nannocystaceae bacterium]